jgi:hypothetical protein
VVTVSAACVQFVVTVSAACVHRLFVSGVLTVSASG